MQDGPSNFRTETTSVSFSFDAVCTLLTIVLVVLKLTHVIDWHWVLVLLPTIINVGLGVLILIIFGIFLLVGFIKDKIVEKRLSKTISYEEKHKDKE